MDVVAMTQPITVELTDTERVRDSFDQLYHREFTPMVRVAYLLVGNEEQALDVVQEAFARVFERWNRLDNPGGVLRTAVVNSARDLLRRRALRLDRRHLTESVDRHTRFEADHLFDAIQQLSPKRRTALVLRYYLDLSEADIAAAMGVRPGTVKSLLSRGLGDLRVAINSDNPTNSDHQEQS
jgi:RNA polymerase sigma-70 factor (sigma-E family)